MLPLKMYDSLSISQIPFYQIPKSLYDSLSNSFTLKKQNYLDKNGREKKYQMPNKKKEPFVAMTKKSWTYKKSLPHCSHLLDQLLELMCAHFFTMIL